MAIKALGVLLLIIAIIGILIMIFTVSLPATAEYNKMFGSHVTMAYDYIILFVVALIGALITWANE